MVDVVLARPGFSKKSDKHWGITPPLGLGYLAAAARENGLTVQVVDGKLLGHVSCEETANVINSYSAQVVGLSSMTEEFPAAKEIASLIKNKNDKTISILGGAHANAIPNETLDEAVEFDYVFAGDGEILFENDNFNKILSGRSLFEIPGLYYRLKNAETAQVKPGRPFIVPREDLFPAWDLFPPAKQYSIMTTRGCPYKCVFCSHNNLQKVRYRPIDDVIDEIKWLADNFDPETIFFEDETFGLSKSRTHKLLNWLADFNKSGEITFKAQTRVDQVSHEMLSLMKRAGFEYIELGVESGDKDVLQRSGKSINLDQAATAVEIAKDVGLKVWLKFIIGLPGETKQSIKNSIGFMARSNPDRLSIAVIVAYPGSEIYEWAKTGENGYRFTSTDWKNFDKYFSNSVELTNLSSSTMRYYQIRAYLETYLRNGRYSELLKLLIGYRSFIIPMLKTTFKK